MIHRPQGSYLYCKNRKTRKGITLIELIITLAIFSILLSISINCARSYKRYVNKINIDYCNNSIMFLINKAKNYCRSKGSSGNILFDQASNSIIFYNSGEINDQFKFPADFKLLDVTFAAGIYSMRIDRQGLTTDACTIKYSDGESVKHEITVCVGTAFVEIKN